MINNPNKVIVTGGSGFIGTNLISDLLKNNHEVLNIDIIKPRCKSHLDIWCNVDLRNRDELITTIKNFAPTQIYHLGARTDLDSNNIEDYSANTVGVHNLIEACIASKSVKRIIFASSRLVCKIGYQPKSEADYCPTTTYGTSKVLGEQIIRSQTNLPFDWVIVRPTSIWGPWFDIPYRSFFDHIKAHRYVHPGKLVIYKSFGFVGNSVFQLKELMKADYELINKKTFYLGDYQPIEVGSFSKKIAAQFHVSPPLSIPFFGMNLLAKLGDTLCKFGYKNPPLTTFRLNNLTTEMIHDFDEISKVTGPLPFTVDMGINDTITWMLKTKI